MGEVLGLALPYFGLILMGYVGGKIFKIPQEGLAWLNTFIVYFALPALIFSLVAQTPFEQLGNWPFILTTTFTTYTAFAIAFVIGFLATRGNLKESTIQGVAGSYSNIGYMGPPLTIAALGAEAAVPAALIFCFDNTMLFTIVPLLMAVAGGEKASALDLILQAFKRILLHPFIVATIAGAIAAYFEWYPSGAALSILTSLSGAAAPCALFAMGIIFALRPVTRVPAELPFLLILKLIVHPILVLVTLSFIGGFDPIWVFTAILMAALPPATNVFVIAQQYDTYVQRASSVVILGTMASVVTLTAVLFLIKSGYVPTDLF
ncbi:MAG: AEC family transporter [Pseudomonadota bacterium]